MGKNDRKPFSKMVEDARKVHGDKYTYIESTYVNAKTPMKIICPIHGEFEKTPHAHINKGRGCSKCNGGIKRTQEEYLELIKKVHGDTYDLSQIKYINSTNDVTPICKKHGLFNINARSFLNGSGCQKCYDERRGEALRYSKEKVIEMCKNVHGNKYRYDNSVYNGMLSPMKIVCPIHGEFEQTPAKHIHLGQGCSMCNQSHLEEEISEILSNNSIGFKQGYKVKWLGLQHLDFYLPKYNIAIECQGEQHYEPHSFNSDKSEETLNENFKLQQQRDQRKKQLCEEHGVKLLYFTHYKDVEESEILFKTKEKILFFIENENNLTR